MLSGTTVFSFCEEPEAEMNEETDDDSDENAEIDDDEPDELNFLETRIF